MTTLAKGQSTYQCQFCGKTFSMKHYQMGIKCVCTNSKKSINATTKPTKAPAHTKFIENVDSDESENEENFICSECKSISSDPLIDSLCLECTSKQQVNIVFCIETNCELNNLMWIRI